VFHVEEQSFFIEGAKLEGVDLEDGRPTAEGGRREQPMQRLNGDGVV
jgi:hypothetical protein